MKEKIKLFFNYQYQIQSLNLNNKRQNVYNVWLILSHIKDGFIFEESEKSGYEKLITFLDSFSLCILSAAFIFFICLTHSFFIANIGFVSFYLSVSFLSVSAISGLYTGMLHFFKHEEESVVSETYLIKLNKDNLLNSIKNDKEMPKKVIRRL